ncbi:MAG: hypothetical protein ACR2HD_01845 [Solirubrobacteraceae bacterium]
MGELIDRGLQGVEVDDDPLDHQFDAADARRKLGKRGGVLREL